MSNGILVASAQKIPVTKYPLLLPQPSPINGYVVGAIESQQSDLGSLFRIMKLVLLWERQQTDLCSKRPSTRVMAKRRRYEEGESSERTSMAKFPT